MQTALPSVPPLSVYTVGTLHVLHTASQDCGVDKLNSLGNVGSMANKIQNAATKQATLAYKTVII